MSQVETKQVKLRLTDDPDVLKEMRKRRSLIKGKDGVERYTLSFDSKPFEFRKGITITVGESVANALYRTSAVIMGDDLTGELRAAIERVGTYQLGQSEPEEQRRSMTSCPVCTQDLKTLSALARHIDRVHSKDRPDLNVAPPKGSVDWETPVDEAEFDAAVAGAGEADADGDGASN